MTTIDDLLYLFSILGFILIIVASFKVHNRVMRLSKEQIECREEDIKNSIVGFLCYFVFSILCLGFKDMTKTEKKLYFIGLFLFFIGLFLLLYPLL